MARLRTGAGKKTPAPWEPDAKQLALYERAICGRETFDEIGAAFKLSRSAAWKTYKKVNQWFIPQVLDEIKEEKARQVAMLRNIVAEALKGWDRSQQDAIVKKSGVSADKKTDTTETRGQVGDPRFLTVVLHALADIRKVLGADAAIEVRHTGEVRVAGRSIEDIRAEAYRNIQSLVPKN